MGGWRGFKPAGVRVEDSLRGLNRFTPNGPSKGKKCLSCCFFFSNVSAGVRGCACVCVCVVVQHM